MISTIRKHIGLLISFFSFLVLSIVHFGNLAEITTEAYWRNVADNLTSIGFVSLALTMIQVAIKQGIAEQALQRGLNTERTQTKWNEHRTLIEQNQERMLYLPYFLQIYNARQTLLKKRMFLVNNNYSSETALFQNGKKRTIKYYHNIRVCLTVPRIKWASTKVHYNKHGQIQTLAEYRSMRLLWGVFIASICMVGVTFLTTGLFIAPNNTPFWQKLITLSTYVLTIMISSGYSIVKEYEKGALGIPNDLDELNAIWREFANWETPPWVIQEVEELNQYKEVNKNDQDPQIKKGNNARTALQNKPKEAEVVSNTDACGTVLLPCSDRIVLNTHPDKLGGECHEHTESIGQRPIQCRTDSAELPNST